MDAHTVPTPLEQAVGVATKTIYMPSKSNKRLQARDELDIAKGVWIAGIVYACVYVILLIASVVKLFSKPRRSYICAFSLLACLFGAATFGTAVGGVNRLVTMVLEDIFTFFIYSTLVAIAAESARASAASVGRARKGSIIIGISVIGHILAFVYPCLLASLAVFIVVDTKLSADPIKGLKTIRGGYIGRVLVLSLVVVLSTILYLWGLSLKGMSSRHKWVVPVCLLFVILHWTYLVGSTAVALNIKAAEINKATASVFRHPITMMTWGGIPCVLFLGTVVFAWIPNTQTKTRNGATYQQPLMSYYAMESNISTNKAPRSFSDSQTGLTYDQAAPATTTPGYSQPNWQQNSASNAPQQPLLPQSGPQF